MRDGRRTGCHGKGLQTAAVPGLTLPPADDGRHAVRSGAGTVLRDATTKLIGCATKTKPYATVEVANPNTRKGSFSVDVSFRDRTDAEVDDGFADVAVPAEGRARLRVETGSGNGDLADHCRVGPDAPPQ
ncbi:hypothetical protein [Streptomyces broussonetiae]|uniref:hypothetical protein n=1 Tax=Streptomyces broussonetiae TaxID=2686304 RepID=UPI0035E1BE51